jgi:hypothetical protein
MTIFKTLLGERICYHGGINKKKFEYQALGNWYILTKINDL